MSMLLFYVGENRYVIENSFILQIVPRVPLKKMPYTSAYVMGLLNFEGNPIPVVDFCQLIEQRDAHFAWYSRIILVRDPHSKDKVVGVLGEKVGEIVDLKRSQFNKAGFYLHHFPYLDSIYSDENGVIQHIDIEQFFHFLSTELSHSHNTGKDNHDL